MSKKKVSLEVKDPWMGKIDVRIFCAIFLATAFISGIIGIGMNQKTFDEFNSTHTCFLNSSMQPSGQKCHTENITAQMCLDDNCQRVDSGMIVCKMTQIGKCKNVENYTLFQEICTPNPMKKCLEWTIRGCNKEVKVGIREGSDATDISMGECDNQEKICTKYHNEFDEVTNGG